MAALPSLPDRIILLGRIIAPFGVLGWVKLQPYTSDPEGLLAYGSFLVGRDQPGVRINVQEARVHGRTVLCKLEDIDGREAAAELKGSEVAVFRHEMPESGPNEYYWTDLVGLEVQNTEGVRLGTITEMIDNGAQSVMVVTEQSSTGRTRLIPFVAAFLREVSLVEGRVLVEWGADF